VIAALGCVELGINENIASVTMIGGVAKHKLQGGTPLYAAPVQPRAEPAQEPCYCDKQRIGDKNATCGDCPRDYTAPQARQPLTTIEIANFAGTHEFGPDQLKWFRLGEAAHSIKGGDA